MSVELTDRVHPRIGAHFEKGAHPYGGGYYTAEIDSGTNGEPILITPRRYPSNITCTLIAGANTGKFQITTSSDDDVNAGTATWQDWAKGTSTGTVSDVLLGPVTGLRGVSVSGMVSIEVVV